MTTSDFATRYRVQVRALYDARKELKTLAELAPPILAALPDGPLPGSNADFAKADLVAAVQAAGELETHLTDATTGSPTPTNLSLQKLL